MELFGFRARCRCHPGGGGTHGNRVRPRRVEPSPIHSHIIPLRLRMRDKLQKDSVTARDRRTTGGRAKCYPRWRTPGQLPTNPRTRNNATTNAQIEAMPQNARRKHETMPPTNRLGIYGRMVGNPKPTTQTGRRNADARTHAHTHTRRHTRTHRHRH